MMHALDPWFVIVGPLYYFGHNFLNFEPIFMKLGDIETSFQALSNKHIHSTTNLIIERWKKNWFSKLTTRNRVQLFDQ